MLFPPQNVNLLSASLHIYRAARGAFFALWVPAPPWTCFANPDRKGLALIPKLEEFFICPSACRLGNKIAGEAVPSMNARVEGKV